MTPSEFRAARKKLGTQVEVAAMLGVSRRTLQGWEAGDAPKVAVLAMRWLCHEEKPASDKADGP